jgi:hypothetical protein
VLKMVSLAFLGWGTEGDSIGLGQAFNMGNTRLIVSIFPVPNFWKVESDENKINSCGDGRVLCLGEFVVCDKCEFTQFTKFLRYIN